MRVPSEDSMSEGGLGKPHSLTVVIRRGMPTQAKPDKARGNCRGERRAGRPRRDGRVPDFAPCRRIRSRARCPTRSGCSRWRGALRDLRGRASQARTRPGAVMTMCERDRREHSRAASSRSPCSPGPSWACPGASRDPGSHPRIPTPIPCTRVHRCPSPAHRYLRQPSASRLCAGRLEKTTHPSRVRSQR